MKTNNFYNNLNLFLVRKLGKSEKRMIPKKINTHYILDWRKHFLLHTFSFFFSLIREAFLDFPVACILDWPFISDSESLLLSMIRFTLETFVPATTSVV